jgi:hypothetical protein
MGALFGLLGTLANVLDVARYLAFRRALLAGEPTLVARLAV